MLQVHQLLYMLLIPAKRTARQIKQSPCKLAVRSTHTRHPVGRSSCMLRLASSSCIDGGGSPSSSAPSSPAPSPTQQQTSTSLSSQDVATTLLSQEPSLPPSNSVTSMSTLQTLGTSSTAGTTGVSNSSQQSKSLTNSYVAQDHLKSAPSNGLPPVS